MLSPEQRKRLQEMTPVSRKRIALLALKKIKDKRAALQTESVMTSINSEVESLEAFANGDFPSSSLETLEERRERQAKGRQSESLRLKERLSQIPFHAQRAAEQGETYWLRLAGSYQGD